METELCKIMNNLNSDKGSKEHNYTKIYYSLFKEKKFEELNVFELGIAFGASLRGWKQFFPNSKIYGGDCEINNLFEEKNIKTYLVNQNIETTIHNLWNNQDLKHIELDIIIDDAEHNIESNLFFLKHSFHKLKKSGIYVIEDIVIKDIPKYTNRLQELLIIYPNMKYKFEITYEKREPWNNDCLILLTRN